MFKGHSISSRDSLWRDVHWGVELDFGVPWKALMWALCEQGTRLNQHSVTWGVQYRKYVTRNAHHTLSGAASDAVQQRLQKSWLESQPVLPKTRARDLWALRQRAAHAEDAVPEEPEPQVLIQSLFNKHLSRTRISKKGWDRMQTSMHIKVMC